MRPLGSDTFVIQRAALIVDPVDGSEYRDWNNPTLITVINSNVQPFKMAEKLNIEDNRDREFSQTAVRVYAPASTRFEPTDRLLFDGDTYEILAHDGPWRRFDGSENHVQVIARLRTG